MKGSLHRPDLAWLMAVCIVLGNGCSGGSGNKTTSLLLPKPPNVECRLRPLGTELSLSLSESDLVAEVEIENKDNQTVTATFINDPEDNIAIRLMNANGSLLYTFVPAYYDAPVSFERRVFAFQPRVSHKWLVDLSRPFSVARIIEMIPLRPGVYNVQAVYMGDGWTATSEVIQVTVNN